MGLLDSILSEAMKSAGGSQPAGQPAIDAGTVTSVIQMLNSPQLGGLDGVVRAFEQQGLGKVAQSWVSTGQNLPATPQQVEQGLGAASLGAMAKQMGIQPQMMASVLSMLLPIIIDKLTPQGKVPEKSALDQMLGGLTGGGGLGKVLGGLLGGR